MFKVGIKHGIVPMNSNSSYRAAPVFVRYIAILAGVVNFLPHPQPPPTPKRARGEKNQKKIYICIFFKKLVF